MTTISTTSSYSYSPTRSLDLGHCRLAYERVGRGPDLVFVHGWPLTGATWRHVIERLRGDFTCHVFDLPGTGATEHTDATPFTLSGMGETVRQAIDAMGLESYALLGHDSGGLFARLVAADDPRVRGLVVGNSEIPGYRPPAIERMLKLRRVPGVKALLRLAMRSRAWRRSAWGYGGCFVDLDLLDGEFGDLFVRPLLESRRAFQGQMGLMDHFDWSAIDGLAEVHARIGAPVQLIWGADDPWFPLRRARGMVDQFRAGAELAVIDPGKLFVHEERPERWVELCRPFLKRCFEVASRPAQVM